MLMTETCGMIDVIRRCVLLQMAWSLCFTESVQAMILQYRKMLFFSGSQVFHLKFLLVSITILLDASGRKPKVQYNRVRSE